MDISLILNLALVGLIVLIIIFGLIGVWKGLWKTGFKLVFRVILFAIAIFTLQPLTKFALGFNVGQFFSFSYTINNVTVPMTTIGEFVSEVLKAGNFVEASALATLNDVAMATASSIVSYILFIVLVLLIVLLGGLLATLFYHCLFKFIIPKKVRKNHKYRWAGLGAGILDGALILSFFLAPFTSLINRVAIHEDTINRLVSGFKLDKNTADLISDTLKAYSNSILSKVINITGKPGNTLDIKLIDKISESTVNGTKVSIFDEVDNILDILDKALASLSPEDLEKLSTDYMVLLNKGVVSSVLNGLKTSGIILSLMPVLANVGVGMLKNNTDENIKKLADILDVNNINWENEITMLDSLYGNLYDSGLIEAGIIEKDFGKCIDRKNQDYMNKAFDALATSEVMSKNLPAIMSFLGQTSLKGILPSEVTDYDGISFGMELKILYASLLDINDVVKIDFSGQTDFAGILLDAISTKPNEIKSVLVGVAGSSQSCLLDSELIYRSMDNLVTLSLSQIAGFEEFVNKDDIIKITSGFDKPAWKDEFGSFIDIGAKVVNNPNLPLDNLDLANPLQIAEIKTVVNLTDKSQIVNSIMPDVLEKSIGMALGPDGMLGLKATDFDFRCEHLSLEVGALLDVYTDALDLKDSLAGTGSATDQMEKLDVPKMVNVLKNLQKNKIVNPRKLAADNVTVIKDTNFNAVVKEVLGLKTMQDVGVDINLVDFSSLTWEDTVDAFGNVISVGEITNLGVAVQCIKDESKVFLTAGGVDINTIEGQSIENVFTTLGASRLFGPSLPGILNKNICPLTDSLGVSIDFNDVTDFAEEGKNFNKVITNMKAVGDLAKVDWLSQDYLITNRLLTSLKETQVLGVKQDKVSGLYKDKFGSFIYTILGKTGLTGTPDAYFGSLTEDSFTEVDEITGTPKTWGWAQVTDPTGATTTGEIYTLTSMIQEIQFEGDLEKPVIPDPTFSSGKVGLDRLMTARASENGINAILKKVSHSETFGSALPNIMDKTVASMSLIKDSVSGKELIDLKQINAPGFGALDDVALDKEIDHISGIYGMITDKTNDLGAAISDPSKIDEKTLLNVETLLDDMASTTIFNTIRMTEGTPTVPSVPVSELTVFEQAIDVMMDKTNMTEMLKDPKSPVDAKRQMIDKIISIDKWEKVGTEMHENHRLIEIMRRMKGIDLTNISNPKNLDPAIFGSIMGAVNESHLLHAAIPNFFDSIFTAININSMLNETVGGVLQTKHNIDAQVNRGVTADEISFWDNEILTMVDLFGAMKDDKGNMIDMSTGLKFGEGGFKSESILKPISTMKLLDNKREYLVSNLFIKTGIDNFLREAAPVPGETLSAFELKGRKVNELLFATGRDIVKEAAAIDNISQIVKNNADASFKNNGTGAMINTTLPVEIISKTFSADNYKVSLMSEILAGFFTDGLDKLITEPSEKLGDFWYSNNYEHLNIVEARGLEGLLKFSELFNGTSIPTLTDFANNFKAVTKKMGIDGAQTTTNFTEYAANPNLGPIVDGYFVTEINTGEYQYSSTTSLGNDQNSLIAKKLFKIYANDVQLTINIPNPIPGQQPIATTFKLLDLVAKVGGSRGDMTKANFNFEAMGTSVADWILNPQIILP